MKPPFTDLPRKMTCCYLITNSVNGKKYVGSAAVCTYTRWHCHLTQLRSGNHGNKHLQSAWNKYGENSFDFTILEECPAEECENVEDKWITELNSADQELGYNICKNARNCLGVKRSEETKAKMRELANNRSPEHNEKLRTLARTPERRALSSKTHKGKKTSEETKLKLSEASKAQRKDPEYAWRQRMAKLSRKSVGPTARQQLDLYLGKRKHTAATKAKQSISAKNRDPETAARIQAAAQEAKKAKRAKFGTDRGNKEEWKALKQAEKSEDQS